VKDCHIAGLPQLISPWQSWHGRSRLLSPRLESTKEEKKTGKQLTPTKNLDDFGLGLFLGLFFRHASGFFCPKTLDHKLASGTRRSVILASFQGG